MPKITTVTLNRYDFLMIARLLRSYGAERNSFQKHRGTPSAERLDAVSEGAWAHRWASEIEEQVRAGERVA